VRADDYLLPSRLHVSPHLGTRRCARIVDGWVKESGLDSAGRNALDPAYEGVALAIAAAPALQSFGLRFFVTDMWNPVTKQFGALAPVYGTVVTSVIALLIGIPVSFGIALFLTEMCPVALKRPLGTAVELLAAIPSIIYGMWGLFVFAPFFDDHVQPVLQRFLGGMWPVGPLFQGPANGGTRKRRPTGLPCWSSWKRSAMVCDALVEPCQATRG
jgi:hypothetical protein